MKISWFKQEEEGEERFYIEFEYRIPSFTLGGYDIQIHKLKFRCKSDMEVAIKEMDIFCEGYIQNRMEG